MFKRIILALLFVALSSYIFVLGQQTVPSTALFFTFNSLGEVVGMTPTHEGTLGFLVGSVLLALLTFWMAVLQLAALFAAKTQRTSGWSIFFLGLTLCGAAYVLGAYMPLQTISLSAAPLWLLDLRVAWPAWAALLPMALVLLNFVREFGTASRLYENAAAKRVDPKDNVGDQINDLQNRMNKGFTDLDARMSRGFQEVAQAGTSKKPKRRLDDMKQGLDGLFAETRAIKKLLRSKPPALAADVASTGEEDTGAADSVVTPLRASSAQ